MDLVRGFCEKNWVLRGIVCSIAFRPARLNSDNTYLH